jgi:hypothetical protein
VVGAAVGQGNLFELEGPELVAGVDLRRSQGRVRVTVTFLTADGHRRLRFDGPDPLEEVFPIVDAEQVWVYLLEPQPGQPLRTTVEYFAGDYHEFAVDAVVDLDPPSYDTRPDTPLAALTSE